LKNKESSRNSSANLNL